MLGQICGRWRLPGIVSGESNLYLFGFMQRGIYRAGADSGNDCECFGGHWGGIETERGIEAEYSQYS